MRKITNMDEIKQIEYEMMRKVHLFCEEFGIKYCLAYGTLLGAVRHSGFIPWDDDIDIVMLRDDYNKLVELFPEWGKKNGLFIANASNEEHFYPHPFSKICDASTRIKERMLKHDPELGVYIDVFVLDEVPANKIMRKIFLLCGKVLYRLMVASNTNVKSEEFFTHYSIVKRWTIRFLNNIPQSLIYRLMETLLKTCKYAKSNDVMTFEEARTIFFQKQWFQKRVLHKFEKDCFWIPYEYDEFLKLQYGDYMKLPPEEQQQPHHLFDAWYIGEE